MKQAISKSALDKENSRQPQGTVTSLTEKPQITNQITVKFVGKTVGNGFIQPQNRK